MCLLSFSSVTGASSGFGRSIVERVLENGGIAVATLRKPEVLDDLKVKYPPTQLLVLKLDVTKTEDVTNAFSRAKESFGRIDVVYNNAGYGILAEFEGTPEDVARDLFEVNFWGALKIAREAIKFFREINKAGVGGRLLNLSSTVGLNPVPGLGYYTASKFGEYSIHPHYTPRNEVMVLVSDRRYHTIHCRRARPRLEHQSKSFS